MKGKIVNKYRVDFIDEVEEQSSLDYFYNLAKEQIESSNSPEKEALLCENEAQYALAIEKLSEYIDVVLNDRPTLNALQTAKDYYQQENGVIIQMYEIEEGGIDATQGEILRLKQELDASDYKIIKCHEYSLANKPLPYDITQLHTEREEVRLTINELETHLII